MHCVILAGGSGTRFWPLSRKDNPKQLLKIVGDKTMLQITIDRLRKLKSTSEIYIITKKELYDAILKTIKHIKSEKYNCRAQSEKYRSSYCFGCAKDLHEK